MPVTISGDAYYQIEALAAKLSDDNMRALTVELRDSLVAKLGQVMWGGKVSVNIGRGLTQYTEPVRTPTGGWMVGVGSLDILHREDAPPYTIKDFLEWYRGQYMPAEKERRAVEKAIKAKKSEISPAARETTRLRNINIGLFSQYRQLSITIQKMSDIGDRIDILWRNRNEEVRAGRSRAVMAIDISMATARRKLEKARIRANEIEDRIAELQGQR